MGMNKVDDDRNEKKISNNEWILILNFPIIICYFVLLINNLLNLFFVQNDEWILVIIELFGLLVFYGLVEQTVGEGYTLIQKIQTYVIVFLFTCDFIINDSIIGITFWAIVLFIVGKSKSILKLRMTINLFLEFGIVLELFSIVSLLHIYELNSVMASEAQGLWVDILFILSAIIRIAWDEKKILSMNNERKKIASIIPGVLVSIFIIALSCGMYFRMNEYAINPLAETDKSFYIVDAQTGKEAVTCTDGWGVFKQGIEYGAKQRYHLKKTKNEGYWYLVGKNGNVLDIVAGEFVDYNRVCEYKESDTENQYWNIEPQDNGFYKIISYDKNYFMTSHKQNTDGRTFSVVGITSDINDNNQFFYFVNADLPSIPIVGWIAMSNRTVIILLYNLILVGILGGIIFSLFRKEKEGEKNEINNSNTVL